MTSRDERLSNQASQTSFLPFLLASPIDRAAFCSYLTRVCLSADLDLSQMSPVESEMLPPDAGKTRCELDEATISVYLFSLGIGVLCIQWQPSGSLEPDSEFLLRERRQRHVQLLDGTSTIGARSHSIAASAIQESVRAKGRASLLLAPPARPFEYVFSMYALANGSGGRVASLGQLEAALLDPGSVGITDCCWEGPGSPTGLHSKAREIERRFPDLDRSGSSACRISWSSLVVSGAVPAELGNMYLALEVKVQGTWLFADQMSRIQPVRSRRALARIESSVSAFEIVVRGLLALDDSMASERTLRIYRAILETSHVERKIFEAREHVESLRRIYNAEVSARSGYFEVVAQALLFVIACLQLMPLLVAAPLHGPPQFVLLGLLVIFLAVFVTSVLRRQ